MKNIYAIINQKGGVGKTTTAQALGFGLLRRGHRVLFLDLDPQGNLTFSLRATPQPGRTAMEVLTGEATLADALCRAQNAAVLCAQPSLALAEQSVTGVGSEYRLKEALEPLLSAYDYAILDTPPALGVLTVNALCAATRVVIPAQADIYSFQGVGQLYKTVAAVQRYCNPALQVAGILLTRYSPRAVLNRDVAQMLADTAEKIHTRVFSAAIREAVAVREAQANQAELFAYSPRSTAAQDYEAFVDELLALENEQEE